MGLYSQGDLRAHAQVTYFANFVGQSVPRFYYNVNPQLPDAPYGQLIVNTKSEKGHAGVGGRAARQLGPALPSKRW